MQEAGAHVHASHMPHPTDYAPLIITMKTSQRYCCYLAWGSDNCYQFKTFALLMYSRGVSPRIPSNPMMSPLPCDICLHSLILISQSVAHFLASQSVLCLPSQPISVPSSIRPCLHRLHKLWDMLCSLYSDSDQQKDNINHTQPLLHPRSTWTTQLPTSSACYQGQHNPLHQCVETARLSHPLQLHVIIHSQGKCSSFLNAFSIHIDPWILCRLFLR